MGFLTILTFYRFYTIYIILFTSMQILHLFLVF